MDRSEADRGTGLAHLGEQTQGRVSGSDHTKVEAQSGETPVSPARTHTEPFSPDIVD